MLYNRERCNLRDILIEKFWPHNSYESARNSLNVAIHGIRRQIKKIDKSKDYILYKDDRYFFNPVIEIHLDHEDFLYYWNHGQLKERREGLEAALSHYNRAIDIYNGDFMEDDVTEAWFIPERENIREAYLFILEKLSYFYFTEKNYGSALSLCKQILSKDECREDIHRRIMQCYYLMGQRDKAIKQFNSCAAAIKEELNVEPGLQTLELVERIKNDTIDFFMNHF